MFEFKFGLVCTLFTTLILAICVFVPPEERNWAPMSFPLFVFFALFEFIGICLITIWTFWLFKI